MTDKPTADQLTFLRQQAEIEAGTRNVLRMDYEAAERCVDAGWLEPFNPAPNVTRYHLTPAGRQVLSEADS